MYLIGKLSLLTKLLLILEMDQRDSIESNNHTTPAVLQQRDSSESYDAKNSFVCINFALLCALRLFLNFFRKFSLYNT